MEKNKLSGRELDQLKERGISLEIFKNQISGFEEGFPPADLAACATVGHGILSFSPSQIKHLRGIYRKYIDKPSTRGGVLKFVPASGAATRMFKDLYALYHALKEYPEKEIELSSPVEEFFVRIKDFAFYQELSECFKRTFPLQTIEEAIKKHQYLSVLEVLLEKGLAYGSLPKALLLFHLYPPSAVMSIEEHFMEGAQYASCNGLCRLHFTVSTEFRSLFEKEMDRIKPLYEQKFGIHYEISYSEQKPSTDTVAVTLQNEVYKDENQRLVFRPGGHGALIENLNEIKADLVFIKNIDNVTTDSRRKDTLIYKETLAGLLLDRREKNFALLRRLEKAIEGQEKILESEWPSIYNFIREDLQICLSDSVIDWAPELRCRYLFVVLNRPMRVCGMVKNEREPGGGPFWVSRVRTYREQEEEEGAELRMWPIESLQIVESSQVDHEDEEQESIFKSSTHFNPVDLVCSTYSYSGEKFDLKKFIDPMTAFVSQKSVQGIEIKAMELPGLWNGAMADWITLFVEEPLSVFTPVKTVNDLLREVHQI